MTARLLRALLGLVLEDADLRPEQMLVDPCRDRDLRERSRVDGDVVEPEVASSTTARTSSRLMCEAVDGQVLALADAVLLSAERDDGKH